MARFFISYSRKDYKFLEDLTPIIRQVYGNNSVFFDTQIPGGQDWWKVILQEISRCDLLIYLSSNDSAQSSYCRKELRRAIQLGKPILPLIVSELNPVYPGNIDEDIAVVLRKTNCIDMSNGLQNAHTTALLLAAIKKLLERDIIKKYFRYALILLSLSIFIIIIGQGIFANQSPLIETPTITATETPTHTLTAISTLQALLTTEAQITRNAEVQSAINSTATIQSAMNSTATLIAQQIAATETSLFATLAELSATPTFTPTPTPTETFTPTPTNTSISQLMPALVFVNAQRLNSDKGIGYWGLDDHFAAPETGYFDTEISASFLHFEHGYMLWRGDLGFIWVLFDNGTFQYFSNDLIDSLPERLAVNEAPSGFTLPTGGFGTLWHNNARLRELLGWSIGTQFYYKARWWTVEDDRDVFIVWLPEGANVTGVIPEEYIIDKSILRTPVPLNPL